MHGVDGGSSVAKGLWIIITRGAYCSLSTLASKLHPVGKIEGFGLDVLDVLNLREDAERAKRRVGRSEEERRLR